jgi:two-component system, cell cycle sensor histidine kinase and response regulator CckA
LAPRALSRPIDAYLIARVDLHEKRSVCGFPGSFSEILENNKDNEPIDMKAPKVDPEFQYARTVLVVDDDPFILRYVEKALSMAKYNVRTANSEDKALAVLNKQQIDIVLTDIVMGDSDGFRLAARIKERNSGLPVVFMTGAVPETDQHAQELGRVGLLLHKPFGPQQLWDFLAGALSKRFSSVRTPDCRRAA